MRSVLASAAGAQASGGLLLRVAAPPQLLRAFHALLYDGSVQLTAEQLPLMLQFAASFGLPDLEAAVAQLMRQDPQHPLATQAAAAVRGGGACSVVPRNGNQSALLRAASAAIVSTRTQPPSSVRRALSGGFGATDALPSGGAAAAPSGGRQAVTEPRAGARIAASVAALQPPNPQLAAPQQVQPLAPAAPRPLHSAPPEPRWREAPKTLLPRPPSPMPLTPQPTLPQLVAPQPMSPCPPSPQALVRHLAALSQPSPQLVTPARDVGELAPGALQLRLPPSVEWPPPPLPPQRQQLCVVTGAGVPPAQHGTAPAQAGTIRSGACTVVDSQSSPRTPPQWCETPSSPSPCAVTPQALSSGAVTAKVVQGAGGGAGPVRRIASSPDAGGAALPAGLAVHGGQQRRERSRHQEGAAALQQAFATANAAVWQQQQQQQQQQHPALPWRQQDWSGALRAALLPAAPADRLAVSSKLLVRLPSASTAHAAGTGDGGCDSNGAGGAALQAPASAPAAPPAAHEPPLRSAVLAAHAPCADATNAAFWEVALPPLATRGPPRPPPGPSASPSQLAAWVHDSIMGGGGGSHFGVFTAVMDWFASDPAARKPHLPGLFAHIDFSAMSRGELYAARRHPAALHNASLQLRVIQGYEARIMQELRGGAPNGTGGVGGGIGGGGDGEGGAARVLAGCAGSVPAVPVARLAMRRPGVVVAAARAVERRALEEEAVPLLVGGAGEAARAREGAKGIRQAALRMLQRTRLAT